MKNKNKNKKINLPTYWRYGLLICIMLAWIVFRFLFKMSELYVIPVVLLYLLISMVLCRAYTLALIGNYFYIRRKPDKAMKFYEKAVSKKTFNVKALYYYGLEKLMNNKPQEALPVFERAEKLNTKPLLDKLIPLAISSSYWKLGNVDKSIEILEGLQEKYKYLNPSTLVTLGYFYLLKGDYEKAEETTRKALKDNPNNAAAYDNLGQIYYTLNDYKTAREHFEKAISIKADTVESLYYLALIEKAEGNNNKAKELLEKADGCYISGLNTITKDEVKKALSSLN